MSKRQLAARPTGRPPGTRFPEKITVTLSLPNGIRERLDATATTQGLSISAYVRRLVLSDLSSRITSDAVVTQIKSLTRAGD
jgi:hypothetical protein